MKLHKSLAIALVAMPGLLFSCQNNSSQNTQDSKIIVHDSAVVKNAGKQQNAADTIIPQEKFTDEDFEDHVGVCFEKSQYSLPYHRTMDPEKAAYKILPCEISGVDEFLCESKGLRYIALPDYKNVNVVLVPMDCGDFSYRYYLLTIVNKEVVANLYVEGEWYEPDNENYKELTSFSIDENYKIVVVTNSVRNEIKTLKEKLEFQLMANGKLRKI